MDTQELQRNEVTLIDDVESLIDRVRTAHREAQAQADKAKEYASKAIDRAFDAGDLLLLLKPSVKHGQWEAFLADRLPEISVRQAQKYMRIARDLPLEKRTGAFLTVNGALRMLEAPDNEPANEPAANDFVLPWKRSGDPVSVAATVRQWPDLRFAATAYMDTAGMSIKEIAKSLNVYEEEIEPFLNTNIPHLDFTGTKFDAKPAIAIAHNTVSLIKEKAYDTAMWWAERANDNNLANELKSIYKMHKRNSDRIPFNPLNELTIENIMGVTLGRCALGLEHFDPRGWIALQRTVAAIVCACDYALFDTKGGIVDIWENGLDDERINFIPKDEVIAYFQRSESIVKSLSIPYKELGTATLDELRAEKKRLWDNETAIFHGDASMIRLAA